MNLTMKVLALDTVLSILFTVIGGGNFYSFLFFFVLLLLPAILVFVSFETMGNTNKNTADKESVKQ